MVRSVTVVVGCILVMIAFIQQANGLKCHTCVGCKDKGPEVECASGSAVCAKYTLNENVVRSCGIKGMCAAQEALGAKCEECSSDLCNSAAKHSTTTLFVGLSVIASVYALL